MQRVVVTGWGAVSPWGDGSAVLADGVFAARSAIRPLAECAGGPWPARTAAWHPGFNARDHFSALELGTLDRTAQFALVAAREALAMAGQPERVLDPQRCGIHLGTGMGSASTMEATYQALFRDHASRLKPLTVPTGMNNAAAAHLALSTGFTGCNLTYCCACASSAVAIGEGLRRIRYGEADLMLVGGAEALLLPGVVLAWEALRTLADTDPLNPAASCKPFSRQRSGLVLGEGAAMFVIESLDSALARGAEPLAELLGFGSGSDSAHLTRPTVDGQARAMRLALRDASLSASQIGYVNAHGTATLANDATESAAIREVFAEHTDTLPVSSTKAVHGHLMGAAAAIELLVSLLALQRRAAPATAHLEDPDPDCPLDHVLGAPRTLPDLATVMSNSFAFGGTTGVLIAGRYR